MEKTTETDDLKFGLALSGGGSRAIAFHLGCLRVLNENKLLDRINMISSVSGGSVIGALYAYSSDSFEEFDKKIIKILEKGLKWKIAKQIFLSRHFWSISWCVVLQTTMRIINFLPRIILFVIKFIVSKKLRKKIDEFNFYQVPIFSSKTTAFMRCLDEEFFKGRRLFDVSRENLKVIISACELKTQAAFYFTSEESHTWQLGNLVKTESVAKAVAVSAAYPLLLPSLDEKMLFEKDGKEEEKRAIVADGAVYDNLGLNYFIHRLDREEEESVNFVIACVASQGIPDGSATPYNWVSRMKATYFTTQRRTESMAFNLLHRLKKWGEIKGFIMPYLGQNDDRLTHKPPNFVTSDQVKDYSTDFKAMDPYDIHLITTRGEQLTKIMLEMYHSELIKVGSKG